MATLGNIILPADYPNIFIGRLNIDLSDENRSQRMTDLITQWQPDILIDLLGETLYNDFFNNPAEAKWQIFIDGETLTIDNDEKFIWVGVKVMLSNFMYYYCKDDSESFDLITGQKQSNTENSSGAIIDLNKKITRIYNIAIDYYRSAVLYMNYKNDEVSDTFENIETKNQNKTNPFGI